MNCSAKSLANEARCFTCLSPMELSAAAVYLACQWATKGAATCSAPVATAATNVAADSFSANWNGVAGALGYRLDVSTNPAFGNFVGIFHDLDVGLALTSLVTGLTTGVTYYYRVRAVCASGTSVNSNTVSAVPCLPPPAPSLTFHFGSLSQTTNGTGNVGGTIRLYGDLGAGWVLLSEVAYETPHDWATYDPSYSNLKCTEVGNGVDYCGESDFSNVVSISPP